MAAKTPERDPSSIPESELFFWVNDLAERRNEVAHGPVSQLLGPDLLLDYVDFVEKAGKALFSLLYSTAAEHAVKAFGVTLGPPINVYNHQIVCIQISSMEIAVGDILIADTGDSKQPIKVGAIERLEIDGISIPSIAADPAGVKVGIKIPFRTKNNHTFSLIHQAKWS